MRSWSKELERAGDNVVRLGRLLGCVQRALSSPEALPGGRVEVDRVEREVRARLGRQGVMPTRALEAGKAADEAQYAKRRLYDLGGQGLPTPQDADRMYGVLVHDAGMLTGRISRECTRANQETVARWQRTAKELLDLAELYRRDREDGHLLRVHEVRVTLQRYAVERYCMEQALQGKAPEEEDVEHLRKWAGDETARRWAEGEIPGQLGAGLVPQLLQLASTEAMATAGVQMGDGNRSACA